MKKLSIITINYNDALGLKKTIESVINQSFTDYEYIIIDGGSTDGSIDIIKQYEDKITYWVSEPDKGVYNAMNKGIVKSNGQYLHFLNSGDWLTSIEVYNNVFNNKSEYDIIYGNAILVFNNNLKKIYKHDYFNNDYKLAKFLKESINHQSAFINKKLFDKHGLYDEEFKIVSDWKFFLIAMCLSDSTTLYKNMEICYYDMNGISMNRELQHKEMNIVINELIPKPIQNDYRKIEITTNKINFINKFKLTKILYNTSDFFLYNTARILNKIIWWFTRVSNH